MLDAALDYIAKGFAADNKIYYGHRLVARLEPGLDGLLQSEIADALEGGLYDTGYEQGWRNGYREGEAD
jgi:hypothetical protein